MLYQENTLFGKKTSVISFGGAALSGEGGGYGFGEMDEKAAEKLVKEAWEGGINVFDTAPIYGFGLSEERLGKYLPREAIVVNKGGVDWHSTKRVNMSNDPKIMDKMIRESLKRMKREYIDVYMVHWPDPRVDIRRAMEVLRSYQEKSAILHLGLCNTNLEDLQKAKEIGPVEVLQSELNALHTKSFESLGEEWKNYFTMGWGTFDKGILSGRVTADRKYSSDDCRSWAPWWNKNEVLTKVEKVKKLKIVLNRFDISLTQFCLNFNLSFIGISSTLVGIKSSSDLMDVSSALQQNITRETMEEIINQWEN